MYAAVDLGSNSFQMLVASVSEERVQIVDKIKEMVRLAGGLNENRLIDQDTMDTALACLERFGQRIVEIPRENIRAVGTNTLRMARNGNEFLIHAQKALGRSVDIISGREEARLIYLGVAHTIFNETENRIIIDIGGGSTEVIIGKGFDAILTESLYIGCVNMSHRFFPGGNISVKKMRKAILASRQEFEPIEMIFKKTGWNISIGSSGTLRTICDVVMKQGWSDGPITSKALNKLKKEITSVDNVEKLQLDGLPDARKPVFPGGVAILCAFFETMNIESMIISDGALREGLLHDLIGRLQDKDIRVQTVNDLVQRFSIDDEQGRRVETSVVVLFKELHKDWQLELGDNLKRLKWAARLHEIGFTIAHAQHHRHGAYYLNHAELPGFSRQDQLIISTLVRYHRRKLNSDIINASSTYYMENILKLIVILRLAVLMNRARTATDLPKLKLSAEKNNIHIDFPEGWLEDHPLTEADLETESGYLSAVDITLGYK